MICSEHRFYSSSFQFNIVLIRYCILTLCFNVGLSLELFAEYKTIRLNDKNIYTVYILATILTMHEALDHLLLLLEAPHEQIIAYTCV